MRFYVPAFLALEWAPLPETTPVLILLAGIEVQVDLFALVFGALLLILASIGFGIMLVIHRQQSRPIEPEEVRFNQPPKRRRGHNGGLYEPVLLDDRRERELEDKSRG